MPMFQCTLKNFENGFKAGKKRITGIPWAFLTNKYIKEIFTRFNVMGSNVLADSLTFTTSHFYGLTVSSLIRETVIHFSAFKTIIHTFCCFYKQNYWKKKQHSVRKYRLVYQASDNKLSLLTSSHDRLYFSWTVWHYWGNKGLSELSFFV